MKDDSITPAERLSGRRAQTRREIVSDVIFCGIVIAALVALFVWGRP